MHSLDLIADAQADACVRLEERFAVLLGDGQDARVRAADAITRMLESTAPEDLFSYLSPLDPRKRRATTPCAPRSRRGRASPPPREYRSAPGFPRAEG